MIGRFRSMYGVEVRSEIAGQFPQLACARLEGGIPAVRISLDLPAKLMDQVLEEVTSRSIFWDVLSEDKSPNFADSEISDREWTLVDLIYSATFCFVWLHEVSHITNGHLG